MTTILFSATLLVILFLAWFMPKGRDRANTMHRLLIAQLVLIASLLAWSQAWPFLALWLFLGANTLWRPNPLHHLAKLQIIGLLMLGLVVLAPFVTPDVIPVVLMGFVALGLALVGLWAFTSYHVQPNHRDMGLAVACGCAVSLGPLHAWAWLIVLPVLAAPWIARRVWTNQSCGWLLAMGLMALGLVWPMVAGLLAVGLLVLAAESLWAHRVHRTGPDHGRLHYWCLLWQVWWAHPWKARLLGLGWESAKLWGDRINQAETKRGHVTEFFSNPHNEYLAVLFEQGIVGLAALLAFLGWLAWTASQTHPLLLIPGIGLCAMACTTFPWTFPFEIAQQDKKGIITYTPLGCMGMVVVTWLILLLILGGAS
jgi:O-antigen ligase